MYLSKKVFLVILDKGVLMNLEVKVSDIGKSSFANIYRRKADSSSTLLRESKI